MLVRMLYASRCAQPLSVDTLADILQQCRKHNPPSGITGLLCHSGDIFMQVLEGGREAVNQLFLRIATDPRHCDVQVLWFQEITERRFASWSMGEVSAARLNPALVLRYCETAELDPYRLRGEAALALFEDMAATAAVVGRS